MSMQDTHNIVEFVMHELCNNKCFNIDKAAFLIDNPDFNCMKGIVGFDNQECSNCEDIWSSPDAFTTHMSNAPFNKKVRSLQHTSRQRINEKSNRDTLLQQIASDLGLKTYGCCDIAMKHNNHGIFLFEGQVDDEQEYESLLDGVSILCFCPIY